MTIDNILNPVGEKTKILKSKGHTSSGNTKKAKKPQLVSNNLGNKFMQFVYGLGILILHNLDLRKLNIIQGHMHVWNIQNTPYCEHKKMVAFAYLQ